MIYGRSSTPQTASTTAWAPIGRSIRRTLSLLTVLLTIGTISGCGDDPASSTNTTATTAGHIKGKVADTQGKGLAGVKVFINTSTFGGGVVSAATATTKADGTYDVTLPDGIYGVSAEHTTTYNGRQYRLYMSPDDGINGDLIHESKSGYVKNFTWKISGEIPGRAFVPGKPHHYGGYIDLSNEDNYNYSRGDYQAPKAEPFAMGSTFEITLTPDGPLLDGSQGTLITRSYEIKNEYWSSQEYHLLDIPVGRYTVAAAVIAPGGARSNLRVSTLPGNDITIDPSTAAASTMLEFWPVDFSTLTHGTWGTELYLLQ